MNQLVSIQQLQPFATANASGYELASHTIANRLLAAIRRPDLIAVLGFCAIGLILTFATMERLPDFAAVIAQVGAGP